ncbi:MAG: sulfatase-like hydrolase/transferase [Rikenellaceae bacterium]
MKNRVFLSSLAIGSALLPAQSFSQSSTTVQRPNVIFIMADDMGWGDVGFNGNAAIQTPHLDALAQQGVTFDRFYSACAVSSPTRASVLTGRNPYRTGIFNANAGIVRCEEISLPSIMQENGYSTGHFGKWHLGSLTASETDANRGKAGNNGEFNPPSLHGYDDSFVTESKVPTYDPMIAPLGMKKGYWDYYQDGDNFENYGTAYWKHNGEKETQNLSGDDSRVIMDRVLPFIANAKESGKPFMSIVWFHAPHLPCVAGPEEQAIYKDLPIAERNFYGCITAMDKQVGRLIEYLKANSLYNNTIIFFCSDNGPEGDDTYPGATGGLQGRKRSLHEGGIRVPGFVVWADQISDSQRIDTPAFTSDYLPTILDIIDVELSAEREIDGQSILPIILDNASNNKRSKPMVFTFSNQGAVIGDRYKLYFQAGEYSLYDIVEDRAEENNIADKMPQIVDDYKVILRNHIDNCHQSFSGEEYEFIKKIDQTWEEPYTKQLKIKKN